MRARHILYDDNRPTAEWASGDAGVTKGDAGVTAAVTRSLTGAERQARYKARKRAEKCAVGGAEHTVGEVTSPAVTPASLSFFPQPHVVEVERNKKTPARADDGAALDAEFDAFMAGWPASTPLEPALRAYRAARRIAKADELIAGRDRYIATKPPWQNWVAAAKFLNEKRWRTAGRDQTEMLMPVSGGRSVRDDRRPGSVIAAAHAVLAAGPLRRPDGHPTGELHPDRGPGGRGLGEAGDRLMRRIGETPYRSWFSEVTVEGVRDGTVHLVVPRASIRKRLMEHY